MSELKIETPRLTLRLWQAAEAEKFINLARSEGLDDFSTGRFSNMNLEKANKFILEEQSSFLTNKIARLGVFLNSSKEAIGMCGLYKMTDLQFLDVTGIAYRFPKKYWGHGYAQEAARALIEYAFNSLGLLAISAIVDSQNERSVNVVKKIGMQLVAEVVYKNEPRQHWRISVTD